MMKVLADDISAPQAEGDTDATILHASKTTFYFGGTFGGAQVVYSPDGLLPYVPVTEAQTAAGVVTMDIGHGHYKAVVTGSTTNATVAAIQP